VCRPTVHLCPSIKWCARKRRRSIATSSERWHGLLPRLATPKTSFQMIHMLFHVSQADLLVHVIMLYPTHANQLSNKATECRTYNAYINVSCQPLGFVDFWVVRVEQHKFVSLCRTSASYASRFRAVRLPRSSIRVLLPQYLMKSSSILDETHREYSVAPADDLIRFWRSKVKVTAGHWGGKGIYVKAVMLKSI